MYVLIVVKRGAQRYQLSVDRGGWYVWQWWRSDADGRGGGSSITMPPVLRWRIPGLAPPVYNMGRSPAAPPCLPLSRAVAVLSVAQTLLSLLQPPPCATTHSTQVQPLVHRHCRISKCGPLSIRTPWWWHRCQEGIWRMYQSPISYAHPRGDQRDPSRELETRS